MGMGPREWWRRIRGWFRDKILNRTPTHGYQRVAPQKEERTVVYTREYPIKDLGEIDWQALIDGREIKNEKWGKEINYHSSFDYSSFRNVRGQGVQFNYPEGGRQVWQERRFSRRNNYLISSDNIIRTRVLEPVRRFLGLNMGRRIHVSYHGRYPERPVVTMDDYDLFYRYNPPGTPFRMVYIYTELYYQRVLRLYGTRAYFEELMRAGIIEPFAFE